VITTKPLGRNAAEGLRMLQAVESAGIFHGYLEDLVYTPKFLKALESVKNGALGRILGPNHGKHTPAAQQLVLGPGAGRRRLYPGPGLPLRRDCPQLYRQRHQPVEVMCWADTQVKPIEAEDHAIGLVKYENGRYRPV
jgi:hypothetical protein